MLTVSLLIATCGLSTVLIINASAKQSYASDTTFLVANVSYQVVATNAQVPLTKYDYANLRSAGFSGLVALAQSTTHIYKDQQQVSTRRVSLTGIDTVALLALLNQFDNKQSTRARGSGSALAVMPFSSPVGIVHPALLKELNDKGANGLSVKPLSAPDDVGQTGRQVMQPPPLYLPPLVPLDDPSLGNDIVTDISAYFRLFPEAQLNRLLLVSTGDNVHQQNTISLLQQVLPAHLTLVALNTEQQQGQLSDSFHMNLLAMALLMFVVCLFIVINAVNLLSNARMPWYKICRQLGISRAQIFTTQIVEIVLLSVLASGLGIYCSVYLSNIISPSVQATLEGLYGIEVGFGLTSLVALFVQVFGITLCGCLVATAAPFMMVKKSLSSQNSTYDLSNTQRTWRYVFWALGIIFALIALGIFQLSSPLLVLLVGTAFIILSGCCALLGSYPAIIGIVYKILPSKTTMLRVSTKQTIALSGKTKVACCAFFIAATSNIGMNLMVDSFRGATITWLETRLASDYYLYYAGNADIQALAASANVGLFKRFDNELSFKGEKLQQFSYPVTPQFKQAMVFYDVGEITETWQRFEQNEAIFVNQQFAFSHRYKINDTITVEEPITMEPRDYIILGIYYDFGNAYSQVLLPLSAFEGSPASSLIYSINTDIAGLERFKMALANANIEDEATLLSTDELLAMSATTFDRTFLITDGLNIVTLLVAALSLACAIIVLMNDVRPQNMLIRSLGVSAVKTQMLALFQYLLLCSVALLFATPFGIALSWVLIYEINLQAFHWTYPLVVSPMKIIQIYGLSLIVVLLVITVPIFRAGKRSLIEDIRWLH